MALSCYVPTKVSRCITCRITPANQHHSINDGCLLSSGHLHQTINCSVLLCYSLCSIVCLMLLYWHTVIVVYLCTKVSRCVMCWNTFANQHSMEDIFLSLHCPQTNFPVLPHCSSSDTQVDMGQNYCTLTHCYIGNVVASFIYVYRCILS